MSTCRSCAERVVWAVTSNGRRMPVDAEPSPMGNVLLHAMESGPPLAVVSAGPVAGGRMAHHATCPERESWGRARGNAR